MANHWSIAIPMAQSVPERPPDQTRLLQVACASDEYDDPDVYLDPVTREIYTEPRYPRPEDPTGGWRRVLSEPEPPRPPLTHEQLQALVQRHGGLLYGPAGVGKTLPADFLTKATVLHPVVDDPTDYRGLPTT